MNSLNITEIPIKKKRGRKKKSEQKDKPVNEEVKVLKKRGRKPKHVINNIINANYFFTNKANIWFAYYGM